MTNAPTHTRRAVLRTALAAGGGVLAAACGPLGGAAPSRSAARGVVTGTPTPDSAAEKLVADVLAYRLHGPFAWNGGSVTMRLHAASAPGGRAYFVRTDASDRAFAKQTGLVWVPLLANTLSATPRAVDELYLFDDGAPGQLPVIGAVPSDPTYTPLHTVSRVTFTGAKTALESVAAIRDAERRGVVRVDRTSIVVNYPLVKWPGGELAVDRAVVKPLEGGPLLAAPDLQRMDVTFKLHQCYPDSRYIVTDTSAVPMAPMMAIAGAAATAGLAEARATSPITVFGNGIPGPGAMGFQPGIFGAKAGDPAWSPIWDHWTALWKDPARATLVRSQAELDARVRARDIELVRGTPDTKGAGFVVNCPSPIVAANDLVVTGS